MDKLNKILETIAEYLLKYAMISTVLIIFLAYLLSIISYCI